MTYENQLRLWLDRAGEDPDLIAPGRPAGLRCRRPGGGRSGRTPPSHRFGSAMDWVDYFDGGLDGLKLADFDEALAAGTIRYIPDLPLDAAVVGDGHGVAKPLALDKVGQRLGGPADGVDVHPVGPGRQRHHRLAVSPP